MAWQLQDIILFLAGVSFLNAAAATLIFGRITLRYLDRELLAQGLDMAEADPLRLPAYVLVVLSKRPERQPFVPGEAIERLRRRKDIFLARWVFWSTTISLVLAIVYFFGCHLGLGWDCE